MNGESSTIKVLTFVSLVVSTGRSSRARVGSLRLNVRFMLVLHYVLIQTEQIAAAVPKRHRD